MSCNLFPMILTLSLCLLGNATLWAQKNNRDKQSERRENERVAEAQKDVRKHQDDLNEAQKKLRGILRDSSGADAELAKARNHWRETREKVADKMAQSLGIDAALEKSKQAKAELASLSKPIIDQLHQSEMWQAAKKAADQAKVDVDMLREDVQLADDDRKKKIDQLTKLVLKPAELERQAVLDKPEAKRLTDKVSEALAAIEKIRKSIPDEKIDADAAVIQAKKVIEKLEHENKKQSQAALAARSGVQKAQQHLMQAKQKLKQAQAADARK